MTTGLFKGYTLSAKNVFVHLLSLMLVVLVSTSVSAQGPYPAEANVAEGAAIFKNQCASCHNKNMKEDLTGPALGGVEGRWSEYPREDLYKWVRGSQALVAEGHPLAVELMNKWAPTVMSNFPGLTDQEIESVLLYIDTEFNKVPEVVAGAGAAGGGSSKSSSNLWLYVALFGVLAVLALILAKLSGDLQYMKDVADGKDAERKSLLQTAANPTVIGLLVFGLILFGGYTTVNNAINLGRQQGYQPSQPIKFSHALHAGVNKIECQYCHDGARRSKHSVIPAANTCMNCHKAIKKGPQYGASEITKIYASVGFNPMTDKYIENYDQLPREEIEKVYKAWFEKALVDNGGELNSIGKKKVQAQWDGIVSSLTNGTFDQKIAGPIEWVRIHNLPDHVYFNHAQHVSVGKVECQTCHGEIQEMEEVAQYSPLSMGWCINCHRQTEVQFKDNPYYESYEKYHEQLKSGEKKKVVVEDIGGLECQKCHY